MLKKGKKVGQVCYQGKKSKSSIQNPRKLKTDEISVHKGFEITTIRPIFFLSRIREYKNKQAILLWTYLVTWRTLNIQFKKTVKLKSNKIDDVLIKNIKFDPISFSHDVYLLFCKRSERIDEPISRKANDSIMCL